MDAHQKLPPGIIETATEVAEQTHGWAYCGTTGHKAARLKWEDTLIRVKWMGSGEFKPDNMQTTAMIGAFYVIEKEILDSMGGWIALPGFIGGDEEAMSILAAMCQVPITAVMSHQTSHVYRGDDENAVHVPYETSVDNQWAGQIAFYRLLFEDKSWERWKVRLQNFQRDGTEIIPSDEIWELLESKEIRDYGEWMRNKRKLNDEQFFDWARNGGVQK